MNPDNQQPNQTPPPQNPLSPEPGQTYNSQGPVVTDQPAATPDSKPSSDAYGPADTGGGSDKTKKIMMVIGGLLGLFVILIIVALVLSPSKKANNENDATNTPTQENLFKEPTAIELENLNNSISDDITNLSTDADFPSNKLSDTNLSL